MSYREECREQLQREQKLATYNRLITLVFIIFISLSSCWVFSTCANKSDITSVCKLVKKYPITYYRGTSAYPVKVSCNNKEFFKELGSVEHSDMVEGKYYKLRNIDGVNGKWFIVVLISLITFIVSLFWLIGLAYDFLAKETDVTIKFLK